MTKLSSCLYRHFDESGILLYVGRTINAGSRLYSHAKGSWWFHKVRRIEIELVDDAIAAEMEAVRDENPRYNSIRFKMERSNRSPIGRVGNSFLVPNVAHGREDVIDVPVGTSWSALEKQLILATFRKCHGNKVHAAATLNISLKTLYNKLAKWEGRTA